MTVNTKDPVFSAPLAWDDPDFEGKDVSLKDYNVLWHECVANEAIARELADCYLGIMGVSDTEK